MNDIQAISRTASGNGGALVNTNMTVGVIGLGRMGTAMAANLAADGFRVIGYVRTPARLPDLEARGIETAFGIEETFNCDVVITMLPDDAAAREVVFGREHGAPGLAAGLRPDAVHISMSTISPECSGRLAVEHAAHGQGYVAAPVFGNPDAAQARELFVIAAGPEQHIARCRAIFGALGQKTFVVGTEPSAANLIKLLGNVTSAATIEIIGEVVALARKRGLDPELLMTVLTSTMFGGRAHRIFGDKIARQRYATGGFTLPLALKDIGLALAAADAAEVPMPTVVVVRDRMLGGIAHGYADFDWSALGLLAAQAAGLDPPRDAESSLRQKG